MMGQIPVEQQFGLDAQGIEIIDRQNMVIGLLREADRDRKARRQGLVMQMRQKIGGHAIALGDRAKGVDDPFPAQILDNQQAGFEIGRQYLRRTKSLRPQSMGQGHKGMHAFGQFRQSGIGLAPADRRTVGTARRDHQNGFLIRLLQPLIGARRGIALDRHAHGLAPAMQAQQMLDRDMPFQPFRPAAVTAHRHLPRLWMARRQ